MTRLAVAAGLEQKPYAPLWLCGRTAITWFGDIVVSDNQLLRGSSLPPYRLFSKIISGSRLTRKYFRILPSSDRCIRLAVQHAANRVHRASGKLPQYDGRGFDQWHGLASRSD